MLIAVQLELGNANHTNNSVVMITDIGDANNQLVCTTERSPCCVRPYRFGEWYFPNGSAVSIGAYGYSFYRRRRDTDRSVLGGVLLHRRFDAVSPTGIYHCIVPGADGLDQTLYVGLYSTTTNGSGHNMACMLLQ